MLMIMRLHKHQWHQQGSQFLSLLSVLCKMFLFYRCIFFLSRNIPSSFNTSIYSNLFVIYLSVGLVSIPLYLYTSISFAAEYMDSDYVLYCLCGSV